MAGLLFLALPLGAAQLVNYSLYDTADRVDLLLSFDEPYSGRITRQRQGSLTLLSFPGLRSSRPETKELKSALISRILISPKGENTNIMLESKAEIRLSLSTLGDNKFSIRIRAEALSPAKNPAPRASAPVAGGAGAASSGLVAGGATAAGVAGAAATQAPTRQEPTRQDPTLQPSARQDPGGDLLGALADKFGGGEFNYLAYGAIMAALILILILLWWLKKILAGRPGQLGAFNVLYQRPLDRTNKFMILECSGRRYVMIVGQGNVLLESFEVSKSAGKKSGLAMSGPTRPAAKTGGKKAGLGGGLGGAAGGAAVGLGAGIAGGLAGASPAELNLALAAGRGEAGSGGAGGSATGTMAAESGPGPGVAGTEPEEIGADDFAFTNEHSPVSSQENFETFFEENKKKIQELINAKSQPE